MKLRKFVTVLLAFILVLPAAAFSASATDAQEGVSDVSSVPAVVEAYANVRQFELSLGLLNDMENKVFSDSVSRAEFTALLVRALKLSGGVAAETPFSDVTSGTPFAGEVSIAYKLKLVNGFEDGRFHPDEAMSYLHAVKMVVCGMDYEPLALLKGGYPSGYLGIADSNGLLTHVQGEDGVLSWNDAVMMVYNLLTCDMLMPDKMEDGIMKYVVLKGKNLLTERFGLTKASGIVWSAGCMSMRSDFRYKSPVLDVEGLVLQTEIDNSERFLGKTVEAWYDADTNQAVCVFESKRNHSVTIDAEELYRFNGNTLTVLRGEEEIEEKYDIDRGFTFVKNGRIAAEREIEFIYPEGKMTLIDNDGDNAFDVVLADCASQMIIGGINSLTGEIYDANGEMYGEKSSVTLSKDNGYYYALELYDGTETVPIGLNSLEPDMAITLYISGDGMLVRGIASVATLSGVLEQTDGDEYTIDGRTVKAGEYFKKHAAAPVAGLSYKFLLNAFGNLAGYTERTGGVMKYGYLTAVDRDKGIDNSLKLKILTEKNKHEVIAVAEKVKLDGVSVRGDGAEFIAAVLNGEYPRYQMIRYALNSDGELSKMDTVEDAPNGQKPNGDSYTLQERYNFDKPYDNRLTRYVKQKLIWYKSDTKLALPYFSFGSAVCFAVPKALMLEEGGNALYSEDMFRVITMNWENDTRDRYVDAYDYNQSFEPGAVVTYTMTGTSGGAQQETPPKDAPLSIVERVTVALADNEETTKCILAYDGSSFTRKLIHPDLAEYFENNKLIPSPGDIIRISTDASGFINGLAIDARYNHETQKPEIDSGFQTATLMDYVCYIAGTVYNSTTSSFVIYAPKPPLVSTVAAPDDNVFVLKRSDVPVVLFNTTTNTARPASFDDILDMRSVGENPQSAVVRIRYGDLKYVFIYSKD